MIRRVGLVFGLACVAALAAGDAGARVRRDPATYVVVNEAVGVPVFDGDIPDRPYHIIGEVTAGVRKATLFSASASEAKIYRELWERAEKLGADAVINAEYGQSRVTAFSWGKTSAKGSAIKFDGPAKP